MTRPHARPEARPDAPPLILPDARPHAALRPRRMARGAVLAGALLAASCAPRAIALAGESASPARIPVARLAPGTHQVTFTWSYRDPDMFASGEGAVRIAAPDSARIDLFLRGGMGSGFAIVLGDSIFTPGGAMIARFLPPVSMFWAALGRLAVPPGDTTVRVDGAITRADIGYAADVLRVAFERDRLASIERIAGGSVIERVGRGVTEIRYEHYTARRSLALTITRTQPAGPFDAAIWSR